ncbi:hypothetical protein Tco_0587892 [Tanacetum coccineum]
MSHDSPLSGGDTPGSDEGSKKLNELTELCTKLSDKVTSLEKDLKQTKKVYDDEEDLVSEDPSNQGRMTRQNMGGERGVEYDWIILIHCSIFSPTKVSQGEEQSQKGFEVQLDVISSAKILTYASRERVKTYKSYTRKRRSTASSRDNTAGGLFSTAKGSSNEIDKTKIVVESTTVKESFKKLRTAKASSSEPIQEQPTKEPKELSVEELKKMLEIVPVEEIKEEALQVKYPIIDWEIHTEGSRKYWRIIRVRNIKEAYQVFEDMLKGFDREDLVTLWSLSKESFDQQNLLKIWKEALWLN